MYMITDEGLDLLRRKGLTEILNSSFKEIDHYMLNTYPYEDSIDNYAKEHNLPKLKETIERDNDTNKDDIEFFF